MATPPTITGDTPITTRPTNSAGSRISALAAVNFLLAAGILAVGLPGVLGEFRRLPAAAIARAVDGDMPVDAAEIEAALPSFESAAASVPGARRDLAMALLAGATGERTDEWLARATEEFRAYLAEVPGDSRAWVLLARAEQQQGEIRPALQALEMSILTGPTMSGLAVARCALGIDLYPFLDPEARRLVEQQFSLAAGHSPIALAQLVRERRAFLIARVMLVGSPEAMAKFERVLGQFPRQ